MDKKFYVRAIQSHKNLGTPLLPLVFLSILFGSCGAPQRHPMPPLASIEGKAGHFSVGRIIEMKARKAISFPQLLDELQSKRVIFVGESHGNPEHHLMEVQILQGLLERSALPTAVAMEFFQEPQQEALERYFRGQTDEKTFLEEARWEKNWGVSFRFYRPLLLAARNGAQGILAINAPRDIVQKVSRKGLEGLTPAERALLPKQIDLGNPEHRAYLREAFEQHPRNGLPDFENFYAAQCVWEETMAENIARYLRTHGGRLVVFSGAGHIIYGFGIPDRVSRRIQVPMATVLLYPLTDQPTFNRRMADYIWLSSACTGSHARMPPR